MGAYLRVKVLPKVDHRERSEAQLHEGDRVWGSADLHAGGQSKMTAPYADF